MINLIDWFADPSDAEIALSTVTATAVDLIWPVYCADVVFLDSCGRPRWTAATSPAPDVNALQDRYGQGPGLDAAAETVTVVSHDLRDEPRWPQFSSAAVAAGVRTVLSFPLRSHPRRGGSRAALTLYGRDAHSLDAESRVLGEVLAACGAIALTAGDRETQFQSALASRDVIGQAKGMIMERFRVDAVRAFELLTRLSQSSNTRVGKIATEIVAAGPDAHELTPVRARRV